MSTQTDALAAGLQALAEAAQAASNDPADQVRQLTALAGYAPVVQPGSAPIGQAIVAASTATAALCRRAALTSLARACAAFQPASYDDAVALRLAVTDLFDAEIEIAADAGDTASFLALRSLRAAVSADLTARGAQLPRIVTVTRARPLPGLALAYQLYGDASRADELAARAGPVHPAFFGTEFEALSS